MDHPRSVPALLEDIRFLGETQYATVQAVRALLAQLHGPALAEEVKYGGILFAVGGVQFGGVFAYQGHVSVEFGHGARINDPFGHLEGSGKGRRHLKLRSVDDIAGKRLADYLPMALQAAAQQG